MNFTLALFIQRRSPPLFCHSLNNTEIMVKEKLFQKIMWLAQKMGSQIHLRSMRDAFITLIPFLVLSGMMILFNNVVIAPDGFLSALISPDRLADWQTGKPWGIRWLTGR